LVRVSLCSATKRIVQVGLPPKTLLVIHSATGTIKTKTIIITRTLVGMLLVYRRNIRTVVVRRSRNLLLFYRTPAGY